MKDRLQALAKEKVKTKMLDQFKRYEEFLLRENAKYNLTSITDPEEIRQKHFADSMALLQLHDLPENTIVLDVGSGAGFPGVPLKIARPDFHVVLLESSAKKAAFLEMLCKELKLMPGDGRLARLVDGYKRAQRSDGAQIEVHCARAEEAAHDPVLREQFGLVVSRAVAALPMLCELCLPFVEVGGMFVAYKGTLERTNEELKQAENAIKSLGGEVAQNVSRETFSGERTFVTIQKVKSTPTEYPRKYNAITKKPL